MRPPSRRRRSRSSPGSSLIPTPLRVQGTLVLTLAKPAEVYAEVAGRLVELNVRDGEWVKKDTVLATLSNPEGKRTGRSVQQDHDINFDQGPLVSATSPELEYRAQAKQHERIRRRPRSRRSRRSPTRSAS